MVTKDPKIKKFCEEQTNDMVAFEIKQDIDIVRRRLDDAEKYLDTGRGFINPIGAFQSRSSTVPLDLKLTQYAIAKKFCDQFGL